MSTPLPKVGLWGGHGGTPDDIDVPPKRLISLTIRHGDGIDALPFAYVDIQGNKHSTGLWGWRRGGGGVPTQLYCDYLYYILIWNTKGQYFQYPGAKQ